MNELLREQMTALAERLKDAQRELIIQAARKGGMPSTAVVQRIGELEQAIGAVEHVVLEI